MLEWIDDQIQSQKYDSGLWHTILFYLLKDELRAALVDFIMKSFQSVFPS